MPIVNSGPKSFRAIDDAPFVTFVTTLLLLAVTCASLSYYVMFVPIPNPQVKDWNSFLDHFGRLEICLESNSNGFQESAWDAKFKDFSLFKPQVKNESDHVAISLFLRFQMRNLNWFCSHNTNASIFVLSFEVSPKRMGLPEDGSRKLRIGFIITRNQFESACNLNATDAKNFTVSTCVHLSGASTFMPTKGHHEQCLNDQDPAEIFSNLNYSSHYPVFRPLIAPRYLKDGLFGDLSSGSERKVCEHGGILGSPTFISDSEKYSFMLPPDTCRLISYRLLMAAVILIILIPVFVLAAHICRKFDNSNLVSGGQVVPIAYTPIKVKQVD